MNNRLFFLFVLFFVVFFFFFFFFLGGGGGLFGFFYLTYFITSKLKSNLTQETVLFLKDRVIGNMFISHVSSRGTTLLSSYLLSRTKQPFYNGIYSYRKIFAYGGTKSIFFLKELVGIFSPDLY